MAFLTADVVENPGGELPFKVVIKQGEAVLGEWAVESKADGEQQLVDFVREAIVDQTGEGEEDEDEDDDDREDDDNDDDDRPKSDRRKREDD